MRFDFWIQIFKTDGLGEDDIEYPTTFQDL